MAAAISDPKQEKPTALAAKPAKGDAFPQEPPDEEFWEKYSPHYELPIGTFASGAIHLAIVLIAIVLFSQLMKPDENPRVPVRGVLLQDGTAGGKMGGPGSAGSEERKEASNEEPQENQRRDIPSEDLKPDVLKVAKWMVELKDNQEALEKIARAPNFDKLNQLNDELKERLKSGFKSKKGVGNGMGSGMEPNQPGTGAGGTSGSGDANTTGDRSLRWTIVFKTNSGEDYLRQLATFKATIVIPEPPNWKTNRIFKDITSPNPGEPLKGQELPEMQFQDTDKSSASKVARALGLDYDPPYFVAFFPKDVEENLADKEKKYRNRKPEQIYSTTFQVVDVNGKLEIRVTDQIPAKKK